MVLAAVAIFLFSVAQAGQLPRDFSGDAMQRHDSRMMASPLNRIPSLLGMTFWPFNPYYYAPPSLTVVNVDIHLPAITPSTPPASTAQTSPKFWTNHCGRFIEVEMSSATNLIETEQKPC